MERNDNVHEVKRTRRVAKNIIFGYLQSSSYLSRRTIVFFGYSKEHNNFYTYGGTLTFFNTYC